MKTRQELKEEYKQMKYKMGVFQIRNCANNKIFVGSSPDLKAIWHAQKLQLEMGIHSNCELQKDYKAYGPDSFVFEILDEVKQTKDEPYDYSKDILVLEEMVVEELQPFDTKGYNKRKIECLKK